MRLFAARGFRHVTVREICAAAEANVAAVNYHFGDKLGLYKEVLARAINTMAATTDAARRAGEGKPAEARLAAYIRVFVQRVAASHDAWIHQLMAHEIADPTPVLAIVFDSVIRPRLAYVSDIVAELLGRRTDDDAVARCLLSIFAQCHAVMPTLLSTHLFPGLGNDRVALDRMVAHIVDFSLAGIRAVGQTAGAPVRRHDPR
jgi:AcrR family transcriptional regulator